MKRLLLATVALAALAMPVKAAIIQNLGVNPTSAQGDFNSSVGGGAFTDQFTFQLVGSPSFVTFASATNVFIAPTDFITNFTGSLYQQVGAVGGGDDILLSAVVPGVPCPGNPTGCQILAGQAILAAGNYYLQIAGIGGGTSGYGGNLTTAGVNPLSPIPIPGMALAVPIGAAGLLWASRRRKKLAVGA